MSLSETSIERSFAVFPGRTPDLTQSARVGWVVLFVLVTAIL